MKNIKKMSDTEWLEMVKSNMFLSEEDKIKLIMGEEVYGNSYKQRIPRRPRRKDLG